MGNLNRLSILTVLAAMIAVQSGFCSDEIEPTPDKALNKTQRLLRNPQKRAQAVSKTPEAQDADLQVQQLAGNSVNTDAIYDLSADIMKTLVQKTNGDPAKMKELLDQAQNDPQRFAEQFTPDQQKKLQEISRKIPVKP